MARALATASDLAKLTAVQGHSGDYCLLHSPGSQELANWAADANTILYQYCGQQCARIRSRNPKVPRKSRC